MCVHHIEQNIANENTLREVKNMLYLSTLAQTSKHFFLEEKFQCLGLRNQLHKRSICFRKPEIKTRTKPEEDSDLQLLHILWR